VDDELIGRGKFVGFKEIFQIFCPMRPVGKDRGDRSFIQPFHTT
jgi:hypothetical protein